MSESWKIENDLCRCCHSEGTHKKLGDPCLEGEEEIYSEMIHDTLDIDIKPVSGPLGSVTYTICEVCIMRLQDAWSFKQQVLQCERRFLDLYTRNVIKMEPDNVIVIDVKKETADSDNEGFKEERIEDDSGEDFPMTYDDGEIKSDDSMEVQLELRKTKPKPKPKAKPKAAPKTAKPRAQTKKVARPSTAKDAAMTESEQSEQKEKKDASIPPKELSDFTAIEEENRKKYSCNKCSKVLNSRETMRDHIRYIHLKEVQLCVCNTCKKEFNTPNNLKRHFRTMHKPYDCPECSRPFPKTKMGRHRAEEHGVIIAKHTCGICGYKCNKGYTLVNHQRRVHLKEKNVACPTCNMMFFDTTCLRNHMVRHNTAKEFECMFCNKMFRRLHDLSRHVRIHTGDKRKVCNLCGERFVQKASLTHHMIKRHPDAV